MKPKRLEVIVENIPPELIERKNWIVWRWENRQGKWTKPPYQLNGDPAKSNDPETWSDFNSALKAFKNGGAWDGIGFVLSKDGGLAGVDWDDCLTESGEIEPGIMEHAKALDSYTEVSPSGRGMKSLVFGRLPKSGHHGSNIGVFDTLRYFCVTGNLVPFFSPKIEPRQSQLESLVRKLWPGDFEKPKARSSARSIPEVIPDDEIVQKALAARDGAKFRRLWEGDFSGYPSQSEADAALCSKLSFWTGRDAARIDGLFRQSGLMRDKWDRDDYRERTISRAIGLTSEVYEPRGSRPDPGPTVTKSYGNASQPAADDSAPTSADILMALGRGEDGDAELFTKLHRGRLSFDHCDRRWYEFTGHYWTLDRTEKALAAVSAVIDLYAGEAKRQGDLKQKAVVENRKDDAALHGAMEAELLKRIGKLHGRQRKENVLALAAAGDGSLGITGLEWDQQPYLLGCPNGVLELRRGDLRPGRPDDYLRTATGTTWGGVGERCPTWDRFINEVFDNDQELIAYVQALLGYGLIGDTPLHIIPILYGRGRNGKGTMLETIKHVLGPYAFKAEAEMLLDSKACRTASSHNSGILALHGKRIVWTSEIDEGRRFNAARVKELVGGDTLSGRAAYGRDHKEFRPSHLLLLLTNAKPGANAADYALWQRIHLIEFGLSFVENPTEATERKADPLLGEKLKAEASGILAWMVRGCQRYLEDSLRVPARVRSAVQRYRQQEDVLGHFIDACCVVDPSGMTNKGDLYRAYKEWCGENGVSALGSKRFFPQMDERFDSYAEGRRQVYTGVKIAS